MSRLLDIAMDCEGEVVGFTFEGDDLAGVELGHIDFTDCSFIGVNFAGAHAVRASLSDCTLEACDLAGAALPNSYWGGCTVHDCRATGADLSKSFFRATTWSGGSLSFASLAQCKLERSLLSHVDLSETVLLSMRLVGKTRFEHCNLTRAEVVNTRLAGCDLSTCMLAGLRVSSTLAELRGAMISADQAIDLIGLLGVRIIDLGYE